MKPFVGSAKPNEGLLSGSWFKIKRSKTAEQSGLQPNEAHLNGRCSHPIT